METRSHGDGGCTGSSTSPDRPQPSLSADPVWAGASACQPLLRTFSDLAPLGLGLEFQVVGGEMPQAGRPNRTDPSVPPDTHPPHCHWHAGCSPEEPSRGPACRNPIRAALGMEFPLINTITVRAREPRVGKTHTLSVAKLAPALGG